MYKMKSISKNFLFSILVALFLVQCNGNSQKSTADISPDLNKWFKAKQVADGVWQIRENNYDNIYLVEGDKKALIIDTGLGLVDLDKFIKTLTKLPVIVVDTHGHRDHAGGNLQFSEVFAHPADFAMIKNVSSEDYHKNAIQRALKDYPDFDESFFSGINDIKEPSLISVHSGYTFDLGNRKLEVMEVPGHTEGSIVLIDAENKLLFAGDNDNPTVWLFLEECLPLETYLQTLQNVNARNDEFDTILPGHGDPMDKAFIEEQIVCAQNIISGECVGENNETSVGPSLLCNYKSAGIAYDPDKIHVKQ